MARRDIFNEVLAGLEEVKAFETGPENAPHPPAGSETTPGLSGQQIRDIREKLGVSRSVFANQPRVSPRTLENWEQGRAKPNDQAKALILLVAKHRTRWCGRKRSEQLLA